MSEQVEASEAAPRSGRGWLAWAGSVWRTALVDGEDPRFPPWLVLPGLVVAVVWAAYQAAVGASFLGALVWPGAAIALGITVFTWFGWQLELD